MRIIGILIIVLVLGFFGGYGIMHSQINDNNTVKDANNVIPMDTKSEQHWDNASSKSLTREDAESIAIENADVAIRDVHSLHTKKENYYGVDIYDVEFWAGQKEYNYNIDINTGEILAMDYEIDKKDYMNLVGEPVDEQMAKDLIKQQISGIVDKDIRIRPEHDDGFLQYEAYVDYKGISYEITIDKNTGTFVEWKWEKHHK